MRNLDGYRSKARSMTRTEFLAEHGEPVFVPTKILTGGIHKGQNRARNATMMHVDRYSNVNPLKSSRAMSLEPAGSRQSRRDGLMIGRSADCAVTIADYTISKSHAVWRPGRFPRPATLEDLGSSNGTWLNGEKLNKAAPKPIKSGDTVRFGRIVVDFLSAKDFYERLRSGKL